MVETLLEVRQLSKTFRYRTGWFHRQTVEAVKPLSFTLRERQTLAIIGENGSGKSTLAKMLAGMVEPTSGELLIDDHPLTFGDYSYRSQKIRMIFQDPSTSLNPTEYRSRRRGAAEADNRHPAHGRSAAGPRQLLPPYAGARSEAASRPRQGADPAPEGYRLR